MPRARTTLVSGLTALLVAVAASATAAPALRVIVAIPPQAWFVERIAGDHAEVSILLASGDSPATYEPTPRRMAVLEGADLFLAAGVPFERGLRPRIAGLSNPPVIAGPEAASGHFHHDGLDPHTWLSPAGAAALADTVISALIALRPAHQAEFTLRRTELGRAIAAADTTARAVLADHAGGTFVVFHPAFGHFAAAYGLQQVAIEQDGHEPGARHLAEVSTLARERGVGAVVVQTGFSRRAAQAVASSLDVPIVELDPLARDWDANLIRMATALARVLGHGRSAP
ncbi:MAG: zinc ABC transporter solute-binding protein [bacterium]|nr:zinc ABC transporter solute-binding protein [bacterium]